MPPPDRADSAAKRPIGIFVHHQGRGHAERIAALVNAMPADRPVMLFSAREDIFPPLGNHAAVTLIPSLFEGGEQHDGGTGFLAGQPTPSTLHCAPLGWPTITRAVAILAAWFDAARPALFVTDVSAELGQLARIASVPHVAVVQHGDRGDPGHMASYDAAVGLLAPFDARLEQPERPDYLRAKTHYCGGIGVETGTVDRETARRRLDMPPERDIVLVLAGGGGQGTPTAPLTLGARAEPDSHWVVIGKTFSEWHETPPANLDLRGWVDNAGDWIAAADRIVSSCGNTTVHQVMATGTPWIAIPEWRYFAEQQRKAEALAAAGLCAFAPVWPSHAGEWEGLWAKASAVDPARGPSFVDPTAARGAAQWLENLAQRCCGSSAAHDQGAVAA